LELAGCTCSTGCQIRWDWGLDKAECRHTITPRMLGGRWGWGGGNWGGVEYPATANERGIVCKPTNPDIVMIDINMQYDGWAFG
jgi:hypothetical protein